MSDYISSLSKLCNSSIFPQRKHNSVLEAMHTLAPIISQTSAPTVLPNFYSIPNILASLMFFEQMGTIHS